MRGPCTRRDIQEVALKSASFAAENFVLAISAQGYASCMMEGFDEWRVRRLLKLRWAERVAMVIGVGREAERGTWGPRFRLPKSEVVKKI
jgi:nitroreductase